MQISNPYFSPSSAAASSPKKKTGWSPAKKTTDTKKETLFSEFHALLTAGVDLNRAFDLLIRSEKERTFKTLLETLHREVVGGGTLWQTLARSGHFSALDCGVELMHIILKADKHIPSVTIKFISVIKTCYMFRSY